MYRLVGASGPQGTTSYAYDPVGNRLSKVLGGQTTSYGYDKADRITSAGATSYMVNASGNLVARGTDSFGCDQANRLTSATVSGATSSSVYDGDGKRVSKTVGTTTTSYAYHVGGDLPVLLDDGTRKYVWGAGGLAYSVDQASGAVQVYHTDGLGSVRAISDSSGSVIQTYQTDEFGIPTATQGNSTQPFGFTGEQRDPEDGFVYLRARMYDPGTGRFIQRDPVRTSGPGIGGWNRFTYVGANPVTRIDRNGRTQTGVNPGEPVLMAAQLGQGQPISPQACMNVPPMEGLQAACELGTGVIVVVTFVAGVGFLVVESAGPAIEKAQTALDNVLAKRIPGAAQVARQTGKPVGLVERAAERLKQKEGIPANVDVSIDPETGDIIDQDNGELVGNIYDELGVEGP